MSVCKQCLNPAYKDSLCVEHYNKKETFTGPHAFIIAGPSRLFRNVKAFEVCNAYDEHQSEIVIRGHAIEDYPKIKTLVNTHFKGAFLYLSIFIPAEDLEDYRVIWAEYCKCKQKGIPIDTLHSVEVSRSGIRFVIRDENYMNIDYWRDTINREVGGFLEWCKEKLVNESIQYLASSQFDE